MQMEKPALRGGLDVGVKWDNIYFVVSFSSVPHQSLRLETVKAAVCMKDSDDEIEQSKWEGGFFTDQQPQSMCLQSHTKCHWQQHGIIVCMTETWMLSPCVPAPERCNTSLQHLWSPARSSGSVCWEVDGPELSPHPRCSSLYPRTPAAAETQSKHKYSN